jgi:hypothetical protein
MYRKLPPETNCWKLTCGGNPVGGASRGDYVQDERYIAKSTRMCGAIVSGLHSISMEMRCDYAQYVRYIASEHMDVRRDCSSIAMRQ